MLEFGLGALQVGGVPDAPQLFADALADLQVWGVMDGVLGQVILATLPVSPGPNENLEPQNAYGRNMMKNRAKWAPQRGQRLRNMMSGNFEWL